MRAIRSGRSGKISSCLAMRTSGSFTLKRAKRNAVLKLKLQELKSRKVAVQKLLLARLLVYLLPRRYAAPSPTKEMLQASIAASAASSCSHREKKSVANCVHALEAENLDSERLDLKHSPFAFHVGSQSMLLSQNLQRTFPLRNVELTNILQHATWISKVFLGDRKLFLKCRIQRQGFICLT